MPWQYGDLQFSCLPTWAIRKPLEPNASFQDLQICLSVHKQQPFLRSEPFEDLYASLRHFQKFPVNVILTHGSEYASWCLQHPLLSGHQDTSWSNKSYWMRNWYCIIANVELIIVGLHSRSRVSSCGERVQRFRPQVCPYWIIRVHVLHLHWLALLLQDRGVAGGPATCEILCAQYVSRVLSSSSRSVLCDYHRRRVYGGWHAA